tara:strand:- start:784 stop:1023 length:240 start_codon:yes stop_codon:yes gene_type:complete
MEFLEIDKDTKIYPGEYLLHTPTSQIVMCGAYKKVEGTVRFLSRGKLEEDKVHNFQKLIVTQKERKKRVSRGCGGCKKR